MSPALTIASTYSSWSFLDCSFLLSHLFFCFLFLCLINCNSSAFFGDLFFFSCYFSSGLGNLRLFGVLFLFHLECDSLFSFLTNYLLLRLFLLDFHIFLLLIKLSTVIIKSCCLKFSCLNLRTRTRIPSIIIDKIECIRIHI